MTLSLAAQAPLSFEIKSAQLPLVALRIKSASLEHVAEELARHCADVPDFFDNDGLLIDFSALKDGPDADLEPTPLGFEALLHTLREHKLRPLAVKGGNTAQMALARQAGLVQAEDALLPTRAAPARQPSAPAPTPVAEANQPALVIDKPLRSGQQVYARAATWWCWPWSIRGPR